MKKKTNNAIYVRVHFKHEYIGDCGRILKATVFSLLSHRIPKAVLNDFEIEVVVCAYKNKQRFATKFVSAYFERYIFYVHEYSMILYIHH